MHFLSISDISPGELDSLLDDALEFKQRRRKGATDRKLEGKSVALLFEKPSTRTRVSFEVAVSELGGHAICLNSKDMQLGRGETIEDTAAVMSRYVHAVMARVYSHDTLVKLAATSSVPVINGLSDREHPCQLLADLLTVRENKGKFEGLRFAWIGDGNNVCNSAILACAMTGMKMTVACPAGYEPAPDIIKKAARMGGAVDVVRDPEKAARDADIMYTDVWVSMGDEDEQAERRRDFAPYQINSKLLELAAPDVMVLHCLPAHRGEEISDEAVSLHWQTILEQAENRLHAQKALLVKLIGTR